MQDVSIAEGAIMNLYEEPVPLNTEQAAQLLPRRCILTLNFYIVPISSRTVQSETCYIALSARTKNRVLP